MTINKTKKKAPGPDHSNGAVCIGTTIRWLMEVRRFALAEQVVAALEEEHPGLDVSNFKQTIAAARQKHGLTILSKN